jgi:hypothetical protein
MIFGIQTGTITGYRTGKFLDLENVYIVQVVIETEADATDALLINPSGDDSPPMNGDRAALLRIGNFRFAIGSNDSVAPESAQGEKKLYSRDSAGEVAAFVSMLESGVLNLNGDEDYAVRFTKLETEFNKLKADYNDLSLKWSTFAIAYAPGGPSSVGMPPSASTSSQSTADISSAKVNTVRLP